MDQATTASTPIAGIICYPFGDRPILPPWVAWLLLLLPAAHGSLQANHRATPRLRLSPRSGPEGPPPAPSAHLCPIPCLSGPIGPLLAVTTELAADRRGKATARAMITPLVFVRCAFRRLHLGACRCLGIACVSSVVMIITGGSRVARFDRSIQSCRGDFLRNRKSFPLSMPDSE